MISYADKRPVAGRPSVAIPIAKPSPSASQLTPPWRSSMQRPAGGGDPSRRRPSRSATPPGSRAQADVARGPFRLARARFIRAAGRKGLDPLRVLQTAWRWVSVGVLTPW